MTTPIIGRRRILLAAWTLVALLPAAPRARAEETDPRADALSPNVWRREHRLIDLHMHIDPQPERYKRAIGIMDKVGIGVGIELGSGTLTGGKSGKSTFEQAMAISDEVCPRRF